VHATSALLCGGFSYVSARVRRGRCKWTLSGFLVSVTRYRLRFCLQLVFPAPFVRNAVSCTDGRIKLPVWRLSFLSIASVSQLFLFLPKEEGMALLARTLGCRQRHTFAWYTGLAEHFSADTQQGVVRLGGCARATAIPGGDEPHSPPVSKRSAGLECCNTTTAVEAASSAELGDAATLSTTRCDKCLRKTTLAFSSHDVYAWSAADRRSAAVPLYPCYIMRGCPLMVHVETMYKGNTASMHAIRLYVCAPPGDADAMGQSCVYFRLLPEAVFERWERHLAVFSGAMKPCKWSSYGGAADPFAQVSPVEREVLEMIDLPLPQLFSEEARRHRGSSIFGSCCGTAGGAASESTPECVDAIPM
jgi:hypothetical protein